MNAQICPSIAAYMGASLLASVSIAHVFLLQAGIAPTLFIIGAFLAACMITPKKFMNISGRIVVFISGSVSALICHALLSIY